MNLNYLQQIISLLIHLKKRNIKGKGESKAKRHIFKNLYPSIYNGTRKRAI